MIPPLLTARYALQGVWLALIALVIVVSVGYGLYHKMLIDGYKILFIESEGYRPAYKRVLTDNKRILAAQAEAERLQRQINQEVEDGVAESSERIDREKYEELSDQLAVAEQFIRNNRVRGQADRCPSGPTGAAAQDRSAGDSEAAGATAIVDGAEDLVLVPSNDIRICTTNTLQAEAGREFALDVEARTNPKN